MEERTTQLVRYLNILFWSIFAGTAIIAILQFFFLPPTVYSTIETQTGINLQSAAILVLLGCIPLGLKLYHKKLSSGTLPEEKESRIILIRKWFTIRLILIEIALLFNFIVYFYTQQTSSLFCCAIILLVYLFFCRPNKNEIINILSQNTNNEL